MHLYSYIYIYIHTCVKLCVCLCTLISWHWLTDSLFDLIRFDLIWLTARLIYKLIAGWCLPTNCHNLRRICTPSRLPTQDGNRRTGELPGEESETRWGPDFKRGNALLKRGQVSKPPKKTVVIRIGKIVGRVRWWRATIWQGEGGSINASIRY